MGRTQFASIHGWCSTKVLLIFFLLEDWNFLRYNVSYCSASQIHISFTCEARWIKGGTKKMWEEFHIFMFTASSALQWTIKFAASLFSTEPISIYASPIHSLFNNFLVFLTLRYFFKLHSWSNASKVNKQYKIIIMRCFSNKLFFLYFQCRFEWKYFS